MDKEELIIIFTSFLNEQGKWYNFKDFIEAQGYTMTELGFNEE